MDSLIADCLPFLSDHLQVKDLIRLESVSKQLRDTIRHDDHLFQRAIRSEVGYDDEDNYPLEVPVKKFKDEEESKWKRYAAESYPARLCFHEKLKHDGIVVEDLTVDKIREMGKSMARVRDDLKKGAPRYNEEEEGCEWDQWRASGYLGLRGGYISLDFKVVCGFALVCSVREQHEHKNDYGYEYYHGFLDETNRRFHCALERRTLPLRSNDDIPYAYVPYDFYADEFDDSESKFDHIPNNDDDTDGPEEWERLNMRRRQVDIWHRGDFSDDRINKPKIKWLKDSSDTIFAITMGRQLARRVVQDPENPDSIVLQKLTDDQTEIGKKFLAPHVWSRGATVYNANRMLSIYATLAEYETIKESLKNAPKEQSSG